MLASTYKAMVAQGERYPVKAIGERYHATISTASRWVKRARELGFLDG